MKVLYLVDKYPNSSQPKRGKYPAIRRMMLEKGCDVYMFAFAAQKSTSDFVWESQFQDVQHNGKFKSIVYKDFSYQNLIGLGKFFFRRYITRLKLDRFIGKLVYPRLKRLIVDLINDQGVPDVVHLYGTQAHTSYIGPKLAKFIEEKYKVPLVFNVHGSDGYKYQRGEVPHEILNCFKATSLFAPVSEPLGKNWQGLLATSQKFDVRVIPNPVSDEVFKTNKNIAKFGEFTIVHISTLDANKNVDLIIDAFDVFHAKVSYSRLKIIGNDCLSDKANQSLSKATAINSIDLLGKKSRLEVADILLKSHLYIQASSKETFGIPIVEAMMSGLPVVTTRSGGPESFVSDNIGMVVDRPDPSEITKALLQLHSAYSNYDPDIIRNYAIKNFSEGAVANSLFDMYNSIIKPDA